MHCRSSRKWVKSKTVTDILLTYSHSRCGARYLSLVDIGPIQKRIWKFTNLYKYVVVWHRKLLTVFHYHSRRHLVESLVKIFSTSCSTCLKHSHGDLLYMHSGLDYPKILMLTFAVMLTYLSLMRELEATNGFVRWMDDLDARFMKREKENYYGTWIISLSSQGLSFKQKQNLSARMLLHFGSRRRRTHNCENCMGWWKSAYTSVTETSTQKRFRQFERKTQTGQWDKVFKRYFNLFGLVKDTCLEKHLPLIQKPLVFGMQPLLTLCLSITTRISPNWLSLSGHCEDDVSLFKAVHCLIRWETPATGKIVRGW